MITTSLMAVMAVLNALQLALLVRLAGRIVGAERENARLAERVNDRLTRFGEALSLLTDTTEQGLSSLALGLTDGGRKASTRSTTRSTTRRIVSAIRGGRTISAVAAAEGMSESEIRLHLELGGIAAASPVAEHGALRS